MERYDTDTDEPETRALDFGHTVVELVRDPTTGEWAVREDDEDASREAGSVEEFNFGCTKVRMVRDADAADGWLTEDIPMTAASRQVHAA